MILKNKDHTIHSIHTNHQPFTNNLDIQLWTDSKASLPKDCHLRLVSFINTYMTPAELFSESDNVYQIYTVNKDSQAFFSRILQALEFIHNTSTVSFIVNICEGSDNTNKSLLFYFESRYNEISLFAVPIHLNHKLQQLLVDPIAFHKTYDIPTNDIVWYIDFIRQQASKSPPNTEKLVSSSLAKTHIIDQVLKTKADRKQRSKSLLSRSNSEIGKPPAESSSNRIKLTLQRAVLSGLRLHGITNTSTEYKDLYYHTFKSVEFAFRNHLSQKQLPPINALQDSVDTLLTLYLQNTAMTFEEKSSVRQ